MDKSKIGTWILLFLVLSSICLFEASKYSRNHEKSPTIVKDYTTIIGQQVNSCPRVDSKVQHVFIANSEFHCTVKEFSDLFNSMERDENTPDNLVIYSDESIPVAGVVNKHDVRISGVIFIVEKSGQP